MAIIQKTIDKVVNDVHYYVRVYPVSNKNALQSEINGQVVSVIPSMFPSDASTSYDIKKG